VVVDSEPGVARRSRGAATPGPAVGGSWVRALTVPLRATCRIRTDFTAPLWAFRLTVGLGR
jgi:hypothetical protein